MENTYFFILGKDPGLSLAEIFALLPNNIRLIRVTPQFTIIETPELLKAGELMRQLGGTIKIGEILKKGMGKGIKNNELRIKEEILGILKNKVKNNKVRFGFSFYSPSSYGQFLSLKSLALKLKKYLKQEGIASRWVSSKEPILSSVIVKKNHLLDRGAEFVLLEHTSHLSPPFQGVEWGGSFLGQTLAVQDFEEYAFREFSKPHRPIAEGILPIKLARIIINLAKVQKNSVILDPFCGSGTILTEAIALGYRHILGCDVSGKAVQQAQENIKWLQQALNQSEESKLQFKIQKCDARNLSSLAGFPFTDAIVTEPYLGPLKPPNTAQETLTRLRELSELYFTAFQEFTKVLKPGGRIVFIFPAFQTFKEIFKTSDLVIPRLHSLGLKPIPVFPYFPSATNMSFTPSYMYARPGQRVLREIFVLERAK
jgi:tRNA G10  N-methylase Trm11